MEEWRLWSPNQPECAGLYRCWSKAEPPPGQEEVALSTMWVLTQAALLTRNIFYFVWEQGLVCPGWLWIFCLPEDDLELWFSWFQLPNAEIAGTSVQCEGFNQGFLCVLSKHSASWPVSPVLGPCFKESYSFVPRNGDPFTQTGMKHLDIDSHLNVFFSGNVSQHSDGQLQTRKTADCPGILGWFFCPRALGRAPEEPPLA